MSRSLLVGILCFVGGGLVGWWIKPEADSHEASTVEIASVGKRELRLERSKPGNTGKSDRAKTSIRHAEKNDTRGGSDQKQRIEKLGQEWREQALQLGDAALRRQALEAIRAAMNSSDEDEVVAALTTLSSLGELDFDKASYREAILPHLESDRAEIRLAASFALATSGLQEGDAEKLRQMAREGMGPEASRLLMQIDKMDLTGESGAIVASMVQQGGEFAKKAVQGLWGGKYSPELEASLVEMSRDADIGYEVMYFALSTQRNKGQETVSRLIEILGDSDTQNRAGRAAWGLSYGVEKEQWSEVADAALILVDTRVSGYAWQQAWELVRQYAGEEQVDDLKVLAEKPNVPSKMREMLLNKITALESQNP